MWLRGRPWAVAGLWLFVSLPLKAGTDWTPIADKLAKSVVYLETAKGSCTAWIINADAPKQKDEPDKDYLLTAAHCDGDKMYVDQSAAKVIAKDTKKDLLVLEVDDLDRPALHLAKANPKQGEEVLSFGYGYGLERPMARVTHIADDDTYIPEGGIGGPLMVTDAAFVAGQSGGPVINAAGEVVMIVQLGTDVVGMGVGAEMIKSKTGRYFERTKPKP